MFGKGLSTLCTFFLFFIRLDMLQKMKLLRGLSNICEAFTFKYIKIFENVFYLFFVTMIFDTKKLRFLSEFKKKEVMNMSVLRA